MSEFQQVVNASGLGWIAKTIAERFGVTVHEVFAAVNVEEVTQSPVSGPKKFTQEELAEMLKWHPGEPTTDTPGYLE